MVYDKFQGIRINFYDNDHAPPHFHAYYQDYEAIIEIETLTIWKEEIPLAQLKKIRNRFKNEKDMLQLEFEKLSPRIH